MKICVLAVWIKLISLGVKLQGVITRSNYSLQVTSLYMNSNGTPAYVRERVPVLVTQFHSHHNDLQQI